MPEKYMIFDHDSVGPRQLLRAALDAGFRIYGRELASKPEVKSLNIRE